MTHSSKQSALLRGLSIERSLTFSDKHNHADDPTLRLIGFCLLKLGSRTFSLQPLPNSSIEEVLNHNDIHHRSINISGFNLSQEVPILILTDLNDAKHSYALYRKNSVNWIYDPLSESHSLLSELSIKFQPNAYEIYLSLPPIITGPLSILKFAFSTEVRAIISLIVASACVMLFNLSIPVLTNLLVSRVLPQSDISLLFECFLAVLLIASGMMAFSYLQSLMMLRLESVADLKLQSAVWDRVMKLPMDFITKFTTGDLTSRVNSISQLRQLLSNGVLSSLLSALFAISYFGLMFYYDIRLSIFASVFTFLSSCILVWIIWRSIRIQLPLLESGAEITNFSLQSVMGLPQIRSAGAEPFIFLRWIREVSRFSLLQLRSSVYNDSLEQFSTLISPISSLFIFSVVAYQLLSLHDDAGDTYALLVTFISFNAAFLGFNSAFTGAINTLANVIGKAAVLWVRAKPVIYQTVEDGYLPTAIHHDLRGDFELRDVSYKFTADTEDLYRNLSFVIPHGLQTAITGPSGCGKTTLVRMLLGFTKPDQGSVLVDGIPLNQLSIRTYRRQLGVVMQNARMNAGSIYNIVCGGVQRSESEVWFALEQAAVADEVKLMPMQLDTILSDSGSNISGGQVQRIAIARALITKPRVLIMDEATSALDNKSQELITNTVSELGITRITIAHRLSTIKDADQIIVLQRGLPAVSGNWSSLENTGYIKKMISMH